MKKGNMDNVKMWFLTEVWDSCSPMLPKLALACVQKLERRKNEKREAQ